MKHFHVVASVLIAATLLAAVVAHFLGSTQVTHAATTPSGLSSAYAYIAAAKVTGPVNISIGPLTQVGRACNIQPSTTANNSVNTLSLETPATGLLATIGAGEDTATTARTTTQISSQASETIQHLDILHGLIYADLLKAVAHSELTGTSANSNDAGTIFGNLRIAGQPIRTDVAPNTTIDLANLGYVVLNEQSQTRNDADRTGISINMIDVRVTLANALRLPIGTQIIIGHASSDAIRTPLPRILTGYAYDYTASIQAGVANDSSGPLTSSVLPCMGGTNQNSAADITQLPLGLGSIGTSTTGTSGQIAPSGSEAAGQISIVNVNLLNGLIHIDALDSRALVVQNTRDSRTVSSTFTNAFINGVKIAANPAPNTQIRLPGLGIVTLNEQTTNSAGTAVSVNALDLNVTTSNLLNLPIGAHVILAHVNVGVQSY